MRLIDFYREEIAQFGAVQDRNEVKRHWLRAAIEEMNERSMSAMRVPTRRSNDQVRRCPPFWRRRSDEELLELLAALAPHFRRWENRKLAL